ncbi:hypothetical protein PIB30_078178, partial [Stylosanthes scabra]|nr:hypothetical protein [Stylosanthes scabra]
MRIIVVKGNSFQKSPIQEYGKRATFASFVLQATNALPTLYLVFMTILISSLHQAARASIKNSIYTSIGRQTDGPGPFRPDLFHPQIKRAKPAFIR